MPCGAFLIMLMILVFILQPNGFKRVMKCMNVCMCTHAFALGMTETDLYFGKITLIAMGRTG